MLAIEDSDLSINYNIWLSHTNNDCANRHTWFASCLKLCMKLVASEAASKPHSARASCTKSLETDVRRLCLCLRGQCVPERGWA